MGSAQARATVRPKGSVAIIDLNGDIDGYATEALEAAYAQAKDRHASAILLNFAGMEYMNSKGIALIVVLLSWARRAGQRLLACGLTDHYLEIFQITRLSDYIAIYADEETALAAIQTNGKPTGNVPAWQPVEALLEP